MSNSINTHPIPKPAKSSEAVLSELEKIPEDLRVLCVNYQNALSIQRNLRELAVNQCTNFKGGNTPHNQQQQVSQLVAYQQSEHAQKLTAMDSIVAAMEASPELAKANKTVQPLLAALFEAEEAEAEFKRQENAARNELETKKQAAVDAALAKVEKQFAAH